LPGWDGCENAAGTFDNSPREVQRVPPGKCVGTVRVRGVRLCGPGVIRHSPCVCLTMQRGTRIVARMNGSRHIAKSVRYGEVRLALQKLRHDAHELWRVFHEQQRPPHPLSPRRSSHRSTYPIGDQNRCQAYFMGGRSPLRGESTRASCLNPRKAAICWREQRRRPQPGAIPAAEMWGGSPGGNLSRRV
jgi:hypothetical protein